MPQKWGEFTQTLDSKQGCLRNRWVTLLNWVWVAQLCELVRQDTDQYDDMIILTPKTWSHWYISSSWCGQCWCPVCILVFIINSSDVRFRFRLKNKNLGVCEQPQWWSEVSLTFKDVMSLPQLLWCLNKCLTWNIMWTTFVTEYFIGSNSSTHYLPIISMYVSPSDGRGGHLKTGLVSQTINIKWLRGKKCHPFCDEKILPNEFIDYNPYRSIISEVGWLLQKL